MHKYLFFTFIIISFILLVYILKGKFVTTTMQYFPIDEHATIESAMTSITLDKDKNELVWQIESTSSEESYLRQDVSLLFENGQFKGVLSKWRQQLAHLELSKNFVQKNSSLLQAISFHHGEIHYPNNEINSIQQMTNDNLYYINDGDVIVSFQTANTAAEKKWEKKLNEMTKQQLLYYWNNLIKNLHIEQQDYYLIPLTEIVQYEDVNLPGRSRGETKQIIGQLWEGLYKNYIVLLADEENIETPHYIPLIMVAKDNSHLLVIFELNNKQQKLIQKLP